MWLKVQKNFYMGWEIFSFLRILRKHEWDKGRKVWFKVYILLKCTVALGCDMKKAVVFLNTMSSFVRALPLLCMSSRERERRGGGGHKCEMESPSALLWAVGVWVEMAGPVNRWLEWLVPFGRAGGNLSRATAYPRPGMSAELWFKDGNEDRKKKQFHSLS